VCFSLFTSNCAAIFSSSLSSRSPEASVGGVDAGRGVSDTALLSLTCSFWPSFSSDSDFYKAPRQETRCFDLTRRSFIHFFVDVSYLYTFSRDEGLSAATGDARRRRETASRWRRRRRLGGLLCAISWHRQLVWKKHLGHLEKRL